MAEEIEIKDTGDGDLKYVLHIDKFDGPLDVLWDLIKKAKIDIAEISISSITEQYINYLKLMENLNVKIAIEFIWMASELLFYKSRSLLPTGEIEDEFFTPPLPPELIQKLLEYKKFQKASVSLLENYEFRSDSFTRFPAQSEITENEEYFEISLFDLLKAFADVMESHRVIEQAEIIFDEILVSDRIDYIISMLKEKEAILFAETFIGKPKKAEIIATFLAMLEMAKTKMVRIMQHRLFGDIRIFRNFSMESVS